MDVYVLESKHFHAGIKITEEGEFLQWNNFQKTFEGMASPIEQNDRHIAVLKAIMTTIELPTRLGLRIPPSFHSLILVSAKARIDRPRDFDASRVIKADQLRKRIWKDIDRESALGALISMTKLVSSETIELTARNLAALHRPAPRPSLCEPAPAGVREPAAAPATPVSTPSPHAPEEQPPQETVATGASCKSCASAAGNILYSKYGYYFKCDACSANTNIRFACQPGHRPRLRKAGDAFFRECAECGSSELFHRNVPTVSP